MPAKKKKAGKKLSTRKSGSGKSASKIRAKKKSAKSKKTSKKKTVKTKSAAKRTVKQRPARRGKAAVVHVSQNAILVEPGPPPSGIPPVEEPALNEEAVGIVTHYYSHLEVAVVQINKGALRTGDRIHVKGHTTDFVQQVESMEYDHRNVDEAAAGNSVGIKVQDHAREHDIVYLVK